MKPTSDAKVNYKCVRGFSRFFEFGWFVAKKVDVQPGVRGLGSSTRIG